MASPSNRSSLLLLLFITCTVVVVTAERFRVGDDQGWREPDSNNTDMYDLWAGTIRFHEGDSIYFKYTNDSVWMVDKRGYYHCNTTDPTETFDDGETVYTLKEPGLFYFVSGDVGHCKNGQRLIVDVMALHPPEQPPSAQPVDQPPPPSPHAAASSPGGLAPSALSPQPSAGGSTSVSIVGVLVVAVSAVMQISSRMACCWS